MSERGLVIAGHRGAMAVAPENTLAGFRRGVADGADQLEFDVRVSRDGHLVVMHDATVDRTTDGTGAVADLTWAEVRSLDAGNGERVPELREVWEAFPDVDFQVEIKDPAALAGVLALARTAPHVAGVTITSFHYDVVTTALAADGPWRVGLISGATEREKLLRGLAEHATPATEPADDRYVVLVHRELADEPAVTAYRARGGRTCTWVIREAVEVAAVLEQGWCGITMDDPAIGVAARDAWLAAHA
ncbi:glycerophosphodiester phosphodiesterase [Propionibacteriaceae bacterium Y2011]|uniref:glycerophosphodiester phosphodiesterase n=1 Tax=Microlunatus sp. Y2014 TaxID=3418488 RepID=UPI003B4E4950